VRKFLQRVQKFPGRIKVRICLLFLLITLFVWNDLRLINEVYDKGANSLITCILIYITAFFSIITLFLNKNILVRKFAQVLVFTAIYTDILYLILGNFPFSYPDAINLFNNPGYASGAIATFMVAFITAFTGTAIIYAFLQLSVKKFGFLFSPLWLIPFIIIQLFFYTSVGKSAMVPDLFPSVYRVTGDLLTANSLRPEEHWKRMLVLEQPGSRKVEHLFLIVDESVTGNALSVNGFAESTTPFLKANAEKLINFGIATSFTNFSAGSNLALMSGLQLSNPAFFNLLKKPVTRHFCWMRSPGNLPCRITIPMQILLL
jgi:glucan phosphoethanolaminetransferase (alkaline phosphatase superfamily)